MYDEVKNATPERFIVVYEDGHTEGFATLKQAKDRAIINFRYVKQILSDGELVEE